MAVKKTTMSVREMREILGLKKTDSYWLVHKNYFKTVLVNGKMRIDIESFEKWYANQVKYKKVSGPPPGKELRKISYSPQEIAEILHISDSSVYYLINRDHIPTFKVDTWIRIKKTDFQEWYNSQHKHRTDEDRMLDKGREERSLSMPEAARELGITRKEVYQIFRAKKNKGKFVFYKIGDQKRVTRKSFDEWYQNQWEYLKPEDRPSRLLRTKKQIQKKREQKQVQLNPDKDQLSIQEAALLLDKEYLSVYRMVQSGKIKAKRTRKGYFIERCEIDRINSEAISGRKQGSDCNGINRKEK